MSCIGDLCCIRGGLGSRVFLHKTAKLPLDHSTPTCVSKCLPTHPEQRNFPPFRAPLVLRRSQPNALGQMMLRPAPPPLTLWLSSFANESHIGYPDCWVGSGLACTSCHAVPHASTWGDTSQCYVKVPGDTSYVALSPATAAIALRDSLSHTHIITTTMI